MEKENNGWISVKDKLPDIGEMVLVYDAKYGLITTSELTQYTLKNGGVKKAFRDYSYIEYFDHNSEPWLVDVTYWQPLPKPPKD